MTTKTAECIEYTNYKIRVWYDSNRYVTGWETINEANAEFEIPDSAIVTIPWKDKDMLNAFTSLRLSEDFTTIAPDSSKYLFEYQESKKQQLNRECQERILKGFDYTFNGVNYHVSYDQEAQTNFDSTNELFRQGVVQQVQWTVTLGDTLKARVTLDQNTFLQLYVYATLIKQYKVSHYRDKLIPAIELITTVEELQAFTWESVQADPLPEVPVIDSNGDGEVSQEEFDNLVAKNEELETQVDTATATAKDAVARAEQAESALLDAITLIFESMNTAL